MQAGPCGPVDKETKQKWFQSFFGVPMPVEMHPLQYRIVAPNKVSQLFYRNIKISLTAGMIDIINKNQFPAQL